MDRTAIALGAPTGVLASTIGLRARPGAERVVADYGLHIGDTDAVRVAEQTLLTPVRVRAMHLAVYDGRVLRLSGLGGGNPAAAQRIAMREWVMPHGSRACPSCLAERPSWKLKWKLSLSAVCTAHQIMLADTCARGHALLLTGQGRARPLSRTRLATPTRCGAVLSHGMCDADLTEGPGPDARVPAPVMDLQRLIDATVEGQSVTLAGRSLNPLSLHDQLRGLVALMRHAGTAPTGVTLPGDEQAVLEDHLAAPTVGGGVRGYNARPHTAVMSVAVLAALAPLVAAAGDDELLARLEPVIDASNRRRSDSGHNPLKRVALPDVVRRAIAPTYAHARVARHAHQPRREASATNMTGGPANSSDLAPQHVPQLLPSSIYQDHIRAHLPGTAEVTGRRYAALGLARLAGAPSWGKAAAALGGDPVRAARLADVLSRRLQDPGEFWTALDTAAEHLAAAGIDYRARERALRTLREVDPRALPDEARLAFVPWTRPRRRHAATWVWVEVGGGDPRASPATDLLMKAASRESSVEGWRRFRSTLPPVTRRALQHLGIALCEENP
jgi:hypothetical protein